MSPTTFQIAWATGFLEGEGCFTTWTSSGGFQITVSATQVQREPLERLAALFGGALNYHPKPKVQPGSHVRHRSPIWKWTLGGARAVGLMYTMYATLSPRRREQVRAALAAWRTRPTAAKYRSACINGHQFDTHGATKPGYTTERTRHRRCLTCHREATRRFRAAARARRLMATVPEVAQ